MNRETKLNDAEKSLAQHIIAKMREQYDPHEHRGDLDANPIDLNWSSWRVTALRAEDSVVTVEARQVDSLFVETGDRYDMEPFTIELTVVADFTDDPLIGDLSMTLAAE